MVKNVDNMYQQNARTNEGETTTTKRRPGLNREEEMKDLSREQGRKKGGSGERGGVFLLDEFRKINGHALSDHTTPEPSVRGGPAATCGGRAGEKSKVVMR